MSQNIFHTLILGGAFLLLFAFGELLYRKFKLRAEVTRKVVHVITGLLTLLFPPLLSNHWFVMALCGSFLLILLISIPFKLLPSINAVQRSTRGSFIYPIVVYCCYLLFSYYDNYSLYYIPILILAICDPIAEMTGKTWPYGKYTIMGHTKTLMGSAGFFVAALLTTLFIIYLNHNIESSRPLFLALIVAFFTTIAEGLAQKGYDNLSIPAAAVAVLWGGAELNWFV